MSLFESLKTIANTLKEANKIEQYQQILEVQQQLLEIQEKNRELVEENRLLREDADRSKSLFFENEAYWINNEEKKDGPFCKRCRDVDKLLVRLDKSDHEYNFCPNCRHTYAVNWRG